MPNVQELVERALSSVASSQIRDIHEWGQFHNSRLVLHVLARLAYPDDPELLLDLRGRESRLEKAALNLEALCALGASIGLKARTGEERAKALALFDLAHRRLAGRMPREYQELHVMTAHLDGRTRQVKELSRSYAAVTDLTKRSLRCQEAHPRYGGSPAAYLRRFKELADWPELVEPEAGAALGFDGLRTTPLPKVERGPLISVVMTCYKPGAALLTAVRSIVEQTWQNWELLLVDDASGPEYESVLLEAASLDPRVKLLIQPENAGTYQARNRAMAVAAGKYIAGLDSDDWSHPRRLEVQVRPMINDSRLVMVESRCIAVAEDLSLMLDPQIALIAARSTPIMIRAEAVLGKVGFYDEVRKTADSEYRFRIQTAFGKGAFTRVGGGPYTAVRYNDSTLSAGEVSRHWMSASRFAYYSGFARWHRAIGREQASPFLASVARPRPFPIARDITRSNADNRAIEYERIYAADWSTLDERRRAMLDDAEDRAEEGAAIALVHCPDLKGIKGDQALVDRAVLTAASERGLDFIEPAAPQTALVYTPSEEYAELLRFEHPGLAPERIRIYPSAVAPTAAAVPEAAASASAVGAASASAVAGAATGAAAPKDVAAAARAEVVVQGAVGDSATVQGDPLTPQVPAARQSDVVVSATEPSAMPASADGSAPATASAAPSAQGAVADSATQPGDLPVPAARQSAVTAAAPEPAAADGSVPVAAEGPSASSAVASSATLGGDLPVPARQSGAAKSAPAPAVPASADGSAPAVARAASSVQGGVADSATQAGDLPVPAARQSGAIESAPTAAVPGAADGSVPAASSAQGAVADSVPRAGDLPVPAARQSGVVESATAAVVPGAPDGSVPAASSAQGAVADSVPQAGDQPLPSARQSIVAEPVLSPDESLPVPKTRRVGGADQVPPQSGPAAVAARQNDAEEAAPQLGEADQVPPQAAPAVLPASAASRNDAAEQAPSQLGEADQLPPQAIPASPPVALPVPTVQQSSIVGEALPRQNASPTDPAALRPEFNRADILLACCGLGSVAASVVIAAAVEPAAMPWVAGSSFALWAGSLLALAARRAFEASAMAPNVELNPAPAVPPTAPAVAGSKLTKSLRRFVKAAVQRRAWCAAAIAPLVPALGAFAPDPRLAVGIALTVLCLLAAATNSRLLHTLDRARIAATLPDRGAPCGTGLTASKRRMIESWETRLNHGWSVTAGERLSTIAADKGKGPRETQVEALAALLSHRAIRDRQRARTIRADIVIVSTFNLKGGTTSANEAEILTYLSAGLTVALVHHPVKERAMARPIDPKIRALIDGERVIEVNPVDTVQCDLAIVRFPVALENLMEDRPQIEAARTVLLVNQTPFEEYGPVGGYGTAWSIGDVHRNVTEWLGHHTWYAIGPAVRDVLHAHHAEEMADIELAQDFWYETIDIVDWTPSQRRVRADGEPIRLGRHSRDHVTKFPNMAKRLLAAYPAADDIEVHMLGGHDALQRILGSIPPRWSSLPFGTMSAVDFLAEVDVYAYFIDENLLEAFGRAPMEAMAAGLPTILPPNFAELFGDGAVYCEPEGVAAEVRRLAADRDYYAERAEAGLRVVRERFSPEALLRRVNGLGVTTTAPAPDARPNLEGTR